MGLGLGLVIFFRIYYLRNNCRQIVTTTAKKFFYNVFFYNFIQLCDSRKIHYLTREFRVKLHWKTDIALIASRFVRYRFSRAI